MADAVYKEGVKVLQGAGEVFIQAAPGLVS
jgi:hypothetical protein